jgi:hypothetical protein
MTKRRIFRFFLTGAIVLAFFGCQSRGSTPSPSPLTPTMEGTSQGATAFLWLAADKDAWVGCRAQNCADGDLNHGTLFSIDISAPTIPPGTTRIYVEFYLPELPDGTVVEEAYINLYEDSRQIPGNESRPVIKVLQEWDPRTINHNNQPMPIGYLSEDARLGPYQDVNEWRGTYPFSNNLASVVQEHLRDPGRNHGFLINNPSNITYLRSFRSDNALSRTETDMDFSPRLLIKVRLPNGTESFLGPINVVLPPLPPDTDLDENLTGPDVLMVRIAGGAVWPASWDVAFN